MASQTTSSSSSGIGFTGLLTILFTREMPHLREADHPGEDVHLHRQPGQQERRGARRRRDRGTAGVEGRPVAAGLSVQHQGVQGMTEIHTLGFAGGTGRFVNGGEYVTDPTSAELADLYDRIAKAAGREIAAIVYVDELEHIDTEDEAYALPVIGTTDTPERAWGAVRRWVTIARWREARDAARADAETIRVRVELTRAWNAWFAANLSADLSDNALHQVLAANGMDIRIEHGVIAQELAKAGVPVPDLGARPDGTTPGGES